LISSAYLIIREADNFPEQLPAALSDRLGFLVGRTHLALRAIAEPALAPFGLGVKDFGALSVLVEEGPLSQQRLGERQGVDRTTMVAVVDNLERRGLVERRRDPRDRRAYSLHATARGRKVLRQAGEAARRAEEEFLAPIPPSDRRRLKQLLRAVLGFPDDRRRPS
jgi:DNA-binding MarR family transcriptional regulator